jgi:predicted amino acid dehydrogenase
MKFGFIAHARGAGELRKLFLLRHTISLIPFKSSKVILSRSLEEGLVKDVYTYRKVYSAQQTDCSGKVFCVFLTPEQLLGNQTRAVELVVEACCQAERWGAEIVGLGAMTAVIGSRGKEINAHSPVPATTGNSLTVYSSLKAFKEIVRKLEIDLSEHKIVIVGFPGSITLAIAKSLLKEGLNLVLVSRRHTRFLQRFLSHLDTTGGKVEITGDLSDALKKGKIIFSATSTGNIIDPDILQPGSIVFDIAQPRDVINKRSKRKDILILSLRFCALFPLFPLFPLSYLGMGVLLAFFCQQFWCWSYSHSFLFGRDHYARVRRAQRKFFSRKGIGFGSD